MVCFRNCWPLSGLDYENTEYKVEGENCDDGDQPGEEDQDWQGQAEITEYWPLLSSPPPFSTYLFRSLLEPFVQTTIDWTTDMAATVAKIIKQITGLK